MRARFGAALAASFLSVSAITALMSPARAEDCGPLKKLMSLDLSEGPGGVGSIPVTINGSPRKLIFSTAGGRSVLTQAAADSLGLHSVTSNMNLLSSSGNASNREVQLNSLVIGGMEAKGVLFQISPNPLFVGNPQNTVDGALANDIMENYDLDLDYAGAKVSYFLPEHCDGHVVYWTATPASVVPFRHEAPGSLNKADTHIRFKVSMDGHDLQAMLNTGTARTTMSARVAHADYNVDQDTQGTTPMGTAAGEKVFGYVFKTINFGDVGVTNPHVAVLPDVIGRNDPNNRDRTNSRVVRVDDNLEPDITIGMDVIRQLHIYVAEKEEKLYITAAAPAGAAAQP